MANSFDSGAVIRTSSVNNVESISNVGTFSSGQVVEETSVSFDEPNAGSKTENVEIHEMVDSQRVEEKTNMGITNDSELTIEQGTNLSMNQNIEAVNSQTASGNNIEILEMNTIIGDSISEQNQNMTPSENNEGRESKSTEVDHMETLKLEDSFQYEEAKTTQSPD